MMSGEGLGARYELKQAYSELYLPELHSWVQMHPAGFRVAYPSRWVNSIYFDTQDLDTLNDHIAGVPVRRKLRYRWYGENLKVAQNGQMEVKNKSEQAGWKVIEKLPADFVLENNNWLDLMAQMRRAASGVVKELLSVSRPVLLTVYYREYYVSSDGRVRLTSDSKLRGYGQLFSAIPNLSFCQCGDEQVILELKSEVEQAAELADILAHFPVRAGRYSKFVTSLWQDLV